jgi:hypothetical protein
MTASLDVDYGGGTRSIYCNQSLLKTLGLMQNDESAR